MALLRALSSPLIFSLLLLTASTSNASILEDVCKSLATNHTAIDYNYCSRFFQANKQSKSTTVDTTHGLTDVAVKKTEAIGVNNVKVIAALRSSEKDEKMQGCLRILSYLYAYTLAILDNEAKDVAISEGELQALPPMPDVAQYRLDACEDRFRGKKETLPLIDNNKKTMKLVQSLSITMLLLLITSTTTLSNASLLDSTCTSFQASHPEIGNAYSYCIKFFQSDRGSAAADKYGLAAIAVKISTATAKATGKRIEELERSETDKRRKGCLSACEEVYDSAVDSLRDAADGIKSRDAGGLKDAVSKLSAARDTPDTCEQGFRELGLASPLGAEDEEFDKQSAIALAVTSAIAPPPRRMMISVS
uniref:Pectinesterase inhibitor domain-containing protein n=1 Tax=Leersia perrieri TaxID=77586 RepID=A0A0D9W8Q9_9ORYZ